VPFHAASLHSPGRRLCNNTGLHSHGYKRERRYVQVCADPKRCHFVLAPAPVQQVKRTTPFGELTSSKLRCKFMVSRPARHQRQLAFTVESLWLGFVPAVCTRQCRYSRSAWVHGAACATRTAAVMPSARSSPTHKKHLRVPVACASVSSHQGTEPESRYPKPQLREARTIREPPASAALSAAQRRQLREEAEAPFRKARQFLYAGGVASATIASVIALSSLVALTGSATATESWWQAARNLGIDVTSGVLCAALYRWDDVAAKRRLERMQQGARLAALQLESEPGPRWRFPLASLRGQYRVIITVTSLEKAREWLAQAEPHSDALIQRSVVWVPVLWDAARQTPTVPSSAETRSASGVLDAWLVALDAARRRANAFWIATPANPQEWLAWIREECARASNVKLSDDLTFVIRRDGRVGARIRGLVRLPRLMADLDRLGAQAPR
jgi:hypothetical protein